MVFAILLGVVVINLFGGFAKAPHSAFKDFGKLGIGILAAKEIYDITTKNNRTGIGSPHDPEHVNPNDSKYGQRP